MNSNVRDFFDKPEKYLHRSFGVRLRAEIVRNLIGFPHDARFLDAGCGDGGVSLQFLQSNRITFCDVSGSMLKLVAKQIPAHHEDNATLIESSIENFKSNESFDYVFCIGVLAHVPSIEDCINKLKSMLDQNGTLIIQFSDYDHWLTRVSAGLSKQGYPVNRIRGGEIRKTILGLNFSIDDQVQYNFVLPGMGRLPDIILYEMQRLTYAVSWLRSLGTEHILMLKKKTE